MDIFAQKKDLILAGAAVALVGALVLFGTADLRAPPGPQNAAEGAGNDAKQHSARPAAADTTAGTVEQGGLAGAPLNGALAFGDALAILKDVGEAAYDHFGLTQKDFVLIRAAGFDVIEGNFDICAEREDVQYFLDSALRAGLQVVLPAGAGEAEWGYPCDGSFTPGQKPVWQGEKVREWVAAWKDHPALFAWDTSNEDGGVFPFGEGGVAPDPEWETAFSLSVEQLGQAYRDTKSVDPVHPVMIRMNGWYFYDYADNFFRPGNAFGKGVADIVMVNAYSNVDEYFPDFVSTVLMRAARSIYAIDPKVVLIPALGVWDEPPMWKRPTIAHVINDYNQALKAERLLGVAFFKYGAEEGEGWYLPDSTRGDQELWKAVGVLIKS